ncbi:MAG: inositol monophosphatase family protein [Rhizobiaceae bacterium]|nr:inositol monophosphatase family protein [Rhizobiaceae bacterium]
MADDHSARLAFAIDLARRAGDLGMSYFRNLESLTIESKGHQDLVSEADREVELFVRRELAARYPDDGIVGEEHAPAAGSSGFTWVIDPIDGTANFVAGIPAWCVIIACARNGAAEVGVVHEPATGETFAARRGGGATLNGKPIGVSGATALAQGSVGVGVNNRTPVEHAIPLIAALLREGGLFYRNASGGLMLAYVAAGRLIGYAEEHMNAWDCLAGLLIIEEAGGRIETPDPATTIAGGTIVLAGTPGVFPRLKALAEDAFGG